MADSGLDAGIESIDVVAKYTEAGRFATQAANKVAAAAVAGASITELCILGDDTVRQLVTTVYNKKVDGKPIPKGIAFPTCISVNNIICHFSPNKSDAAVLLKTNDVIKIDVGVHLDGYAAFSAKTIVVGQTEVVTGKAADTILAAHYALEAALRLVVPGNKNSQVTAAIQKIAKDFGCNPVQGMLSYQITRFQVDGDKTIIQGTQEGQAHSECEFAVNEVYAIDILISSGSGKTKEGDVRTTVFQRLDDNYNLKMKSSQELVKEVAKSFHFFPFALRNCEHEIKAKMGSTECVTHRVMNPFPVIVEKEGEVVAQFKSVILLTTGGTVRVSDPSFDVSQYKSDKAVQDAELVQLLETTLGKKKKTKAPKTAESAASAEGASTASA